MSAAALIREIEGLLRGHTDRHDEAVILERLEAADAATLEATLMGLDLRRLVSDVDDRRRGPKHRTALFRLLFEDRLADQSIALRAKWIDALSHGRTSSLDERGIRAILLGTRGVELTRLKVAIDRGEDHRHLVHVIHSDVDDETIRAELIRHIASEGRAVPRAGRKILSDIDDTFYCNWKDRRFPSKTVYPGVRAFYGAMSTDGDVVFVTARPEDRPGYVEASTHATLREHGILAPVVLAGSFLKLHSHAAMADEKRRSFERFAELYPEYELVFVGDSGQGDAQFGAEIREAFAEQVPAVLIHDVVATPAPERVRWAQRGVHFFDTYAGAARRAHALGLLGVDALREVFTRAREELRGLAFETEAMLREREGELDRDTAE
ncbi:MAG: phosphatase domain-containing protein [Sandaracinaceae bacterium]